MKMVDLKLPKKSKKEITGEMIPAKDEGDRYPYGFQLRFENDQIEKLPYLKKFKVGQKVHMMGMGEVTDLHMSERKEGKEDWTVTIQLHEVGCESKGKEKSESMGEAMGRYQKEYTG